MDDATRLIGDLHHKLAQLDGKVFAYRQDLAAEFRRYSSHLLQSVPEHISVEVGRRVAESFAHYPALGPELQQDLPADSPPPPAAAQQGHPDPQVDASQWLPRQTPGSPPPRPFVSPAALSPADRPPMATSASEREAELQGLFTPSYLPLLDSHQHEAESRPTSSSPPLSPPQPSPSYLHSHLSSPSQTDSSYPESMGKGQDDKGKGKGKEKEQSPASKASIMPSRPGHGSTATDDTTSSGASDHNESRVRRSALRRSSTGSKPPPSPRRVRFEFEGGEVLPTSSPQSSEVSLAQSHSLHRSRSSEPSPAPVEEDPPVSAEAILGPDEDTEPPPRKVSSSQALRALSRTPLDVNTLWTVVNAGSPEHSDRDSPRNNASPASSSKSSLAGSLVDSPLKTAASSPAILASFASSNSRRGKKPLKSPPPEPADEHDDEDESSDDDFLAMAKPKSFANKKALPSPVSRSPTRQKTSPPMSPSAPEREPAKTHATATMTHGNRSVDDEEGVFYFEGSALSRIRSMPESIPEEEGEEDEVTTPEEQPAQFSTSPAVSIPKPETPLPPQLMASSVGSFKGRSVTMPVVTNPEVYAQAASLGDISSFIGGLDGRTGADEGDLASYRASVGQPLYSGTPRSLTERMLMEEAQTQRQTATSEQQQQQQQRRS